jgi:hypothetical protein
MPEHQDVLALVDRLVRESRIPSARGRDELRRELLSHFDEVGSSPAAIGAAVDRFGSAELIADGFRRAYRRGRFVLYAAKIVASIVASALAAIVVDLVVSLRFATGSIWLTPEHARTAAYSMAIVLVAVGAWELGVEPLCGRLERRPIRLLVTFATVFAGAYLVHSTINAFIDPGHAFVASGLTIVIWTTTIAILSRFDLAYLRLFGTKT